MTKKLSAQDILQRRKENETGWAWDFARANGISEADLIAAHCLDGRSKRLNVDIEYVLQNAPKLGPVMVLTRNDSAVHEKYGCFEQVFPGNKVSMTLGQIDLRLFQTRWAYAFFHENTMRDIPLQSIQFFNQYGQAVFKLYRYKGTDEAAWRALVDGLMHDDQSPEIDVQPFMETEKNKALPKDQAGFVHAWQQMTDIHQFHDLLKKFEVERLPALKAVGHELAYEIEKDAILDLLAKAHDTKLPIMCFVGNRDCIQIHTGEVGPVVIKGDYANLLDETFHLHLRQDRIDSVWVVKKPTDDGDITSVEAFDADDNLIIQFFGERKQRTPERAEWRALVASLPVKTVSPKNRKTA